MCCCPGLGGVVIGEECIGVEDGDDSREEGEGAIGSEADGELGLATIHSSFTRFSTTGGIGGDGLAGELEDSAGAVVREGWGG